MTLMSPSSLAALATCLLFAAVGIWHAWRVSRLQSLDDYLTARGSIGTGVSIATLVATLAGTWILASPPQIALYFGVAAIIGYCVGQALPMLIFPLVGNRVRREYPLATTLSDAVGSRYGAAVRVLVSLLGLFYMGVYLTVELTTIAKNLQVMAGWELVSGAAIVAMCTIAYAAWGGVRSAIFADRLQIGLIVALLVGLTIVLYHGLDGQPLAKVRAEQPELLTTTAAGWEMAGVLILGIVASNLFDNSFWARIFACRSEAVVRRSFTIAGMCIGVILIPPSLFGLWAIGNADLSDPNVLPFALVKEHAPAWAAIAILILALLLAMSTISALFNGIAGVLIGDARAIGAAGDRRTLNWARVATIAVALPVVWLASQGHDATYLFLIANLACAAAVVPVFLGLWLRSLSGAWVLAGFVFGAALGTLYFPGNVEGTVTWLEVPFGQRFLTSYGLAVGVSTVIALCGALFNRR